MENHELRQKVIELSELGAIKQKRKFLEKASDDAIRSIWEKYELEKLKEVNELATETILKQTSNILCWFEVVKKGMNLILQEILNPTNCYEMTLKKLLV